MGTARLLPSGKIGRMAVLAAWRRRGIGSRLLDTLLLQTRQKGFKKVFLSSHVHVCDFYQRHGFTRTGQVYALAGIPHQDMYLDL